MSGTQVSAWQTPNELLTSMQTPAIVLHNQLANQGAQQELNANEMEQISRASNWVIAQDPENKDPAKQAQAYGAAVKLLRANNYAKNAPDVYPGFEHMQLMARLGTPSAEQFKVGENRSALAALAPGATPPSTAPATDGGGGGTSDNNFGNIRPTGASSGFNTYATPQEGVAAMSSNLAAYANQHGIKTLNGLTARWAPKGDGNNDPTAYAASLGKILGLDPNAEINLADPLLQSRLIPAMAQIEKGRPFSQPRDVLLAGIQAGLGGAPVAAPAAAPGGGVAARYPGAVQSAGPAAGAPAASTVPLVSAPSAAAATPPAPVTTTEPETGLPVLSAPPNQVMPGQPNGPPRPLTASEQATIEAQRTGRPVPVSDRPGFWATPDGTLTTAPGREAPAAAPAAPAATAPAATAPPPPPPQVALPPRPPIGQDGLQDAQRRELAVLRATGRISPADYIARQEQMVSHNDTLLQQWQTDVRQAQSDALTRQDKATTQAREARQEALAAEKWKAEQDKTARDVDNPFGDSESGKLRYILSNPASDPKSPTYHAAWAAYANPQTVNGVVMPGHVMDPFRMPLDADGVPVTTYDKPKLQLAPGDLTQFRKITEQSGTLSQALDDFAATAKKASLTERLKTVAGGSTDLASSWTNLAMLAKGDALYQLGVLSGPDMSVIRGALADPSTFMGSLASTETIDKQVGRIKRILATRLEQAREAYTPGVSKPADAPASPPAPSVGDVKKGYRFKGGDPSDPTSWEKA